MSPAKKSAQAKTPTPETPTVEKFLLTDLRPQKGATRDRLRVGRGRASGAGKTSNRGHNGEGQRSGLSLKRGFEGGQMPLYRRLPRLDGFNMVNRRQWLEINVKDLSEYLLADETTLTYEKMQELGIFKPNRFDGIRILGNGEIKRKVNVEAHHVTPSARQKIEAAGGTVKVLGQAEA
jgi:large subunit ribosomal protein L15